MNLVTFMRIFLGICLCLRTLGCMGVLIGDPHRYAYVTRKRDADTIGKWIMDQNDGQKIYDGLCALIEKMGTAHDDIEVRKAFDWFLHIFAEVGNWRIDRVVSSNAREMWTTKELVQKIFSTVASEAYDHPIDEELLLCLRPDEKHGQWLEEWEKSISHLKGQQRIRGDKKGS